MENISSRGSKPARAWSVTSLNQFTEIIMSRQPFLLSRAALAAACAVLPTASALASQGPGGGMGTAGNLTQVAMAIIVYGASALIIGTGLIGALRR